MRFLSLFSGIEAASCAWLPLGWECVAVAEIEPFARAVLRHHYPNTPNLGDITKITDDQIRALGQIDLVVGGFPCQDLSVAGKRKGLRNDDGSVTRSGLFFDAMRLVRAANPRWLVLENVPGLYSSNDGRDFAAVVDEILGIAIDVPNDGWANTGCAASEIGLVEWATLDARWFGVPQRRRRVFFVADFRDWTCRPPVLFDADSLCWDTAPSEKAVQRVAPTLEARANAGGAGWGTDFMSGGGIVASSEITDALTARPHADRGSDAANLVYDERNITSPGNRSNPAPTLHKPRDLILAFDTTQITHPENRSNPEPDGPAPSLAKTGHAPAIAFSCKDHGGDANEELAPTLRAMQFDESHANAGGQLAVASAASVRRLTPIECERLQDIPDNYTQVPYRGKPAADGPRYRSLGNSFAVPPVRWIGERIEMVEQILAKESAA